MKSLFAIFFLLSVLGCGQKHKSTGSLTDTVSTKGETSQTSSSLPDPYGLDAAYRPSTEHKFFMLTGYFNPDNIRDTVVLIRHKSTQKDALFIKHGQTAESFLLKEGKNVGVDFGDFNWVGQFEVIRKGRKIWNNVIDGEIVGEEQVPEKDKITLQTDAIFLHEDEGGGGGIIYYKNGGYTWVQQD